MNWSNLRYRLEIGGLPWAANAALSQCNNLVHRLFREAPRLDTTARQPKSRILYIHSGWAVENVGKLWFGGGCNVPVDFISFSSPLLSRELLNKYALIWYGYTSLFYKFPCPPEKAIVSIHDPCEMFSETREWNSNAKLSATQADWLKTMARVVVISEEMRLIMENSGVDCSLIPTTSLLPIRLLSDISINEVPDVLSVGRIYKRKNFEQFLRISKQLKKSKIHCKLRCGNPTTSEGKYMQCIDHYPIYLCTSFQEGGPIPVMDAMTRGAVVLSTPVGQVPEIISDGQSGFLCQSDSDFIDKIHLLASDPDLLFKMRLASIQAIEEKRNAAIIASQVSALLGRFTTV